MLASEQAANSWSRATKQSNRPSSTAPDGGKSNVPGDRDVLLRRRNAWFQTALSLAAVGAWGLVAWSFGWPLGGEIRSDPFDQHPLRLTHVVDLAVSTFPHPALARMPVVPAGTAGVLSHRPLPWDLVNAPDTAFEAIRAGRTGASRSKAEAPSYFDWLQAGAVGPANAQSIQNAPNQQRRQSLPPSPALPPVLPGPPPEISKGIPNVQQQPNELQFDPKQFPPLPQLPDSKSQQLQIAPPQPPAPRPSMGEALRRLFPERPLRIEPDSSARQRVVVAYRAADGQVLAVNGAGEEASLTKDAPAWTLQPADAPPLVGERLDFPSENAIWYVFPADRPGAQLGVRIDFGKEFQPPSRTTGDPNFALDTIRSIATVLGSTSGRSAGQPLALFVATESQPFVTWIGGSGGSIATTIDAASDLVVLRRPTADAPPIRSIFVQGQGVAWASSGWRDDPEEKTGRPLVLQTLDGGRTWERLSYRWFPAPWVFVAFLLAIGAFDRGTRAHYAMTQIAVKPRIAEHGVSDDPIGLDDPDVLGLVPIARALSRFLRNIETKPTVTIGVTGAWGSGKSSLMNLVREDLYDRGVRTVWFNAWHHQKEDSLLAALLAVIRAEAVPPLWSHSGLRFRFSIFWNRVFADVVQMAIILAIGIAAIWLLYRYDARPHDLIDFVAKKLGEMSDPSITARDVIEKAVAALGASGGLAGLVYSAFRLLLLFKPIRIDPARLLASVSERASNKDLQQQLAFRHRFAQEFKTFCVTLRRPPHPGLVIFVDDLDRCGSRQTVDVLEAINFVTSAGPCFVVVGFAEDKVKAAIADVYKDTLLDLGAKAEGKVEKPGKEELARFATNYLEKLVHLVVPVPRSGDDAVEKLLGLKPVDLPSAQLRRRRRWQRVAGEAAISAVLAVITLSAVYVSADYLIRRWVPPVAETGTPSAPSDTRAKPGAVASPVTAPAATGAPAAATAAVNRGDLTTWPPDIVLVILLAVLALVTLYFLPRLLAEPTVSDSDDFREALKIWARSVTQRRTTPRAVKRFVNRLRFLAMRVYDIEVKAADRKETAPIDEPLLVTFAAIEDADETRLEQVAQEFEHGRRPTRSQAKTGEGGGADLVVEGLKKFAQQFGREPFADERAIKAYRAISGLVQERGAEPEPAVRSTAAGDPVV